MVRILPTSHRPEHHPAGYIVACSWKDILVYYSYTNLLHEFKKHEDYGIYVTRHHRRPGYHPRSPPRPGMLDGGGQMIVARHTLIPGYHARTPSRPDRDGTNSQQPTTRKNFTVCSLVSVACCLAFILSRERSRDPESFPVGRLFSVWWLVAAGWWHAAFRDRSGGDLTSNVWYVRTSNKYRYSIISN